MTADTKFIDALALANNTKCVAHSNEFKCAACRKVKGVTEQSGGNLQICKACWNREDADDENVYNIEARDCDGRPFSVDWSDEVLHDEEWDEEF